MEKLELKGHRLSVLCLDHSSSVGSTRSRSSSKQSSNAAPVTGPSFLLSGSEDGTARLWDLRSRHAALCIVAPAQVGSSTPPEVTSVAFHPIDLGGGSIESQGEYARRATVYLGVESNVYGYDLRYATGPIVRGRCDHDLSGVLESEDEINRLAFSPAGLEHRVHVAAADDAGDVRVTDMAPARRQQRVKIDHRRRCRVLQHGDGGSAMATCAAFRPRSTGLDLASGGTDCAVSLWDVSRPKRPLSTVKITTDNVGAGQVCNPPMVFDVTWSPSGRLLVAGLGDGTASVLSVRGRNLYETFRIKGGHSSSIASVIFPRFGCDSSSHVAANDRLLISAGSDCNLMLWDLGSEVAGKHAVDPSTWLEGCSSPKSNNDDATVEGKMADLGLKELTVDSPRKLFGIPHEKKMNHLTSSGSNDILLPSTLFVADTTKDITAYILARQ